MFVNKKEKSFMWLYILSAMQCFACAEVHQLIKLTVCMYE